MAQWSSAAPGSSPEHIINTLIVCSESFALWKEQNKQKRGPVWPIYKIYRFVQFSAFNFFFLSYSLSPLSLAAQSLSLSLSLSLSHTHFFHTERNLIQMDDAQGMKRRKFRLLFTSLKHILCDNNILGRTT